MANAINSYSLQIGTWATCRNCQAADNGLLPVYREPAIQLLEPMAERSQGSFSILAYDAPYGRLRTWSEGGKRGRMFSYISSGSSLLHTYDPYGRRTMCCAKSSLYRSCAPVYISNVKSTTRKRGRPTKPKVEKQEF